MNRPRPRSQVSPLSEDQEYECWRRFIDKGEVEDRLSLIEHYLPIARRIAAKLFGNRPDDQVEFGDYMQFAVIGLIEAVDRYNPDREAAFNTFATYRIRGAILNGLEKITERRNQCAYRQRANRDRVESIGADAADAKQPFAEMVDVTIELALSFILDSMDSYEETATAENGPYRNGAMVELRESLAAMLENLPERERLIIRYHYFHNMDFEQLSQILEISKGRVSQLHKSAVHSIREALGGDEGLDLYL